MINTCRICGSVADHIQYQPQERMFGWGDTFNYFKCQDCGCLQIDAPPNDLPRYYPSNYYSLSNQPTTLPGLFKRWVNRKRLYLRLTGTGEIWERLTWRFSQIPQAIVAVLPYLKPISHIRHNSRLLDIGCGEHSDWLGALGQCGFTNLTGVDPFMKNPGNRHGVHYIREPLENMLGEYDLITLHHSLEHIPDQHGTLRQVRRLLAPGGTCLIRIPLVDSLVWERYGIDWVELDAPRHLYLHNKSSLAQLADSHGFELVYTLHDSTEFEFAGSELYRAGIALTAPESFWVNPGNSCFNQDQMKDFSNQASAANQSGTAGRAAFYLKLRSTP